MGGDALAWAVLGLVVGLVADQSFWGAASGAALGGLWALLRDAKARAELQEKRILQLHARLQALEPSDGAATPEPAPVMQPATEAEAPVEATPAPSPPAPAPVSRRSEDDPIERGVQAIRSFFFGGNTVVRVGILVLLVGVTLLGKWAADIGYFPLEARLAAGAGIGLALIAVGYHMRESRPDFGTTLQGGGIAALYLVVFFAFRIFELIPAVGAFALFVAISVACGALALMQRSQPLIFIGSLGGFLAPILAATGQGNHVVLFSYYLLLNLGVAAVSWREGWRALNVWAFVATYGVATVWGVLSYRPEQFATTEPFVVAYLLLFTGVALLFALRRPPELAGLVDGTLVFGTPLVTLLAQQRLVEGIEFGMAYSSAGLSVFYGALAAWLWYRWPEVLRALAEAFLALAVVFGTIAVPLALDDGLSTTLVWALEGAGVFWVGARQNRALARIAGVALQPLAAVAFLYGVDSGPVEASVAVANPRFLACMALALASVFIGQQAYYRERTAFGQGWVRYAIPAWGLLWWSGGVTAEIDRFVRPDWEVSSTLIAIGATAVVLERVAAARAWLPGRVLSLGAVAAAALLLPIALLVQPHLLANGGFVAWPLCLLALYFVLAKLETTGVEWTNRVYAPVFWLVALVVAFSLSGLAESTLGRPSDWVLAAMTTGLGVSILLATVAVERGIGPFARFSRIHLVEALGPVVVFAGVWSVIANVVARGDAPPLPYVPLLNPVDVSLALVGGAAFYWWRQLVAREPGAVSRTVRPLAAPAFGGLAFLWLNAVLVRTVVQWTDVSFTLPALWDSIPLQVSFSIAWTLLALGGMVLSTARGWRPPWLVFATLLGVTVAKLFIVDLSQLSTGAKIGTFLVVGVLLLVVGYLSPVPPSEE